MTYPNAYHGVKKIFTAEILGLIASACVLIASFTAVGAALSAAAESTAGAASLGLGSAVLLAAGLILPLIGYIIQLVGLHQGSKDESLFGTAFWIAIFSLIISIIAIILEAFKIGGTAPTSIAKAVSSIGNILIIVCVIQGITRLADQLHHPEMTSLGTKILVLQVIMYGVMIIITVITAFFGTDNTIATIASVLSLVSGIISVVAYIIYLVYLGKAKSMLKEN